MWVLIEEKPYPELLNLDTGTRIQGVDTSVVVQFNDRMITTLATGLNPFEIDRTIRGLARAVEQGARLADIKHLSTGGEAVTPRRIVAEAVETALSTLEISGADVLRNLLNLIERKENGA